jgi:Adenosine deaminase
MTLDWQVCSRARLSRDPRFDGKFYIGVIGSGVYCRPICPAPTAKEKNVRYFPSAALLPKPDSVHACAAVPRVAQERRPGRERRTLSQELCV